MLDFYGPDRRDRIISIFYCVTQAGKGKKTVCHQCAGAFKNIQHRHHDILYTQTLHYGIQNNVLIDTQYNVMLSVIVMR
jgi:hypothetical protein